MMSPEGNQDYRLDRVERDIAEIKASVMSIQSSVSAIQIGIPQQYFSRRDFADRKVEDDARSKEIHDLMAKRIDKLEVLTDKAGWAVIGALLTAVGALAKAFLG